MTYSQKSIQDAALREATMVGGDPNASPVIDNKVVIEDLFFNALRRAVIAGAQVDSEAAHSKRDYELTLASGSVALPTTLIEECLDNSSIYSESDATIGELSSFTARYSDFIRPVHTMLAYYTVLDGNLLFREAGGAVGAYSGAIHLVALGIPDIPASETTVMDIAPVTAERCIATLAEMLRSNA